MHTSMVPQRAEIVSPATLDISKISHQANILYFEIQKLESQKLLRSLAIGYLLTQAKALLSNGGWEEWVSNHCTFKRSMADEYRFLWEHRHELFTALSIPSLDDQIFIDRAGGSQSQPVGIELVECQELNISIRQALKVIRQNKRSAKKQRNTQQLYHRIEIVISEFGQLELDRLITQLHQDFQQSITKISVREVYRPYRRKRIRPEAV
ncbi:hypothetical protein [Synechococcus elongatus]|uniref:DUF3102 domain-containing protein n=4 Tax=Synechococcus elongatus TaxID=32046 RepID=Q31M91_SYNE7|nr:hypothetical protein [Synechococcus elongatus]MBD2586544.1 hypothetical protein [Synechococcus elongatus FACHB-242]ABB57828.1 conserved hypothetical protein [Synechococcus elongatus PCC 7942 = FACHB-805]AJD57687.1 hypothetical protein M744_07485 [Synechococcus elongatus UTEX 2973]MBD2687618.1 hypothetical protein [Synechococcus elongatus FACHB-1061]MBD2706673.1 hypothetical protein [Synechococcus elongatus PCC 7942 = FACHB-805]